MKKVIFLVGARPNFVKLAPLITAIEKLRFFDPIIVHTGQHYDYNMSEIFFSQLNIPKPNFHLDIGSGSHAVQTAQIMVAFEKICVDLKPDMVVVIGDVNSTIAGALVASKLGISISHVEAGLRSFNKSMPEEINRIITDHLSDLLFAPSKQGIENLKNEGLFSNSFFVGDVMFDAVKMVTNNISFKSDILQKYNLYEKKYFLATLHRPYNVDDEKILSEILNAFSKLDKPVVFSVHPRTLKNLTEFKITIPQNVRVSDPLGYLEFLWLEQNAIKIITDSGGIQKEAYFLKIPCITLRPETEWVETVELNANILVNDRSSKSIIEAINKSNPIDFNMPIYGEGNAADLIINQISKFLI